MKWNEDERTIKYCLREFWREIFLSIWLVNRGDVHEGLEALRDAEFRLEGVDELRMLWNR